MSNCHSPTQPQLELVLDLIMGRKPPTTPPPHHHQELKKSRWNKKRVGGTKKESVEQKKSRWNKKNGRRPKKMEDEPINQNQPNWLLSTIDGEDCECLEYIYKFTKRNVPSIELLSQMNTKYTNV